MANLFVASGRTLASRGREQWLAGEVVSDVDQAAMEAVEPGRVAQLLGAGILTTTQDVLSDDESRRLIVKNGGVA
jgi:hypothetical protein